MFCSRIILFLFGATIISCRVLRNGLPCDDEKEHPIAPEIIIGSIPSSYTNEITIPKEFVSSSPFRAHLPQVLQQGSNLFYKPQFLMSPMHSTPASPIATIIEKDCDDKKTPLMPAIEKIVIEEPIIIPKTPVFLPELKEEVKVMKPIVIPPAPVLPPFNVPELPIIVVEEPLESIIPEAQIIEITKASELQPIIPESPAIVEVPRALETNPIEIPAAPELGPFVMPAIPSKVIVQPKAIALIPETPKQPEIMEIVPCPPENTQPAPVEIEFKPMNIPEAPVLKPFVMPSIPESVLVEVSNTIFEKPGHNDEIVTEVKPPMTLEILPPAPELPPFVLPELPTIQHIEIPQKFEIPEAPVLPPFVPPQFPTLITVEVLPASQLVEGIPSTPVNIQPAPVEIDFKPMDIPEAPVLKPFVMPSIPESVLVEVSNTVIEEPCHNDEIVAEVKPPMTLETLPPAPELPPFEMPELPTIQHIEIPQKFEIAEAPVVPPFVPTQFPTPITVEVLPASQLVEVIPSPPENIQPAPVETDFKPMDIPEAPVLKPFVMPSIPESVLVEVSNTVFEEPCLNDEIVAEIKPPMTLETLPPAPELPPFEMPELPTHIEIPEAPVLPPFVPPQFPTPITVEVLPASQLVEVIPSPPENIKPAPVEIEFKPMVIPEAPVLKPFVMPSIPESVPVEVSNTVFEEPCHNDEIVAEFKPPMTLEALPPAPELSPFAIPELPTIQYNEIPQTIEIPEAPVLPPFVPPQFPTSITVDVLPSPQSVEVIPCPPENIPLAPVEIEFKPMVIPEAPVLKPFVMPSIPETVLVEEYNGLEQPCSEDKIVPEKKPAVIIESLPPAPLLPPFIMPQIPLMENMKMGKNKLVSQNEVSARFPMFCDQNVFIERVLPNLILSEKVAPQGVEAISGGKKYPVYPASYFAPAVY